MARKTKGKPDSIDIFVGQRLRALRQTAGLSQEVLAGKIGLTFQQVQKYERGTNRIAAGRLARIAGTLGVNIGVFFPDEYSDARLPSLFIQNLQNKITARDKALDDIKSFIKKVQV